MCGWEGVGAIVCVSFIIVVFLFWSKHYTNIFLPTSTWIDR